MGIDPDVDIILSAIQTKINNLQTQVDAMLINIGSLMSGGGPSSVKYDFMLGSIGTATYGNTTGGTFWDSTGTSKTAATASARFDYDPADGNESLGLIMEGAATNEVVDVRNMSAWNHTNIIHSLVTGIDGSANAASGLSASATNSTRR